jgi:dTDP-4-amino-4,6-dideoxygalactose transaminase
MPIPLLDLKKQYATIREEVIRVTEEVYDSQAFILGKRVEEFERDFAVYCQSKHAIGVSSGTDALLIALMVLDIEPGDEVIVPAYSFFATAGVVERLGAIPVFVDVNEDDYNISVEAIEKHLTSRTRAIIPVHLFGQTADMEPINAMAAKAGAVVIEDAAQAVGAEYDGVRAGALAPMACFSFFPSKNLGAFGDAGAVTTSDPALAERLFDYRVHGMRPKYFHRYVGGNFRIDALQAAILHVKLAHLEKWTEGRQKNASLYHRLFSEKGLQERVVPPVTLPRRRHVYNQYVVRFPEGRETRDRVMHTLRDAAIGCEIYYPLTLPDQECFRDLPSSKEPFPVSRAAADQSLAIPVFPELSESEIAEVVDTIAKALK